VQQHTRTSQQKSTGKLAYKSAFLRANLHFATETSLVPKFESYAAFETAAFCCRKSNAATERFHGIDDLVFNGLIDDVRDYNRALSSSEVTSIYNAGVGGKSITYVSASDQPSPLDEITEFMARWALARQSIHDDWEDRVATANRFVGGDENNASVGESRILANCLHQLRTRYRLRLQSEITNR
jgi:hypothetical protein